MKKIDEIIAKHLGLQVKDLNDNISSDEESEWDSVTHLKMVSEIEKIFRIKFDINEMISLENVGKIRDMVRIKVGQKYDR